MAKKVKKPTIGDRIKERRQQLGMTQAAVAKKCGVRANYVGYLEGGQRRPSLDLVEKLGKALDLDVATLIDGWFPAVARTREQPAATGDAWEGFSGDKALLTRHGVSPAELDALKALTSVLGPMKTPRDYLFVLDAIRRGRLDS